MLICHIYRWFMWFCQCCSCNEILPSENRSQIYLIFSFDSLSSFESLLIVVVLYEILLWCTDNKVPHVKSCWLFNFAHLLIWLPLLWTLPLINRSWELLSFVIALESSHAFNLQLFLVIPLEIFKVCAFIGLVAPTLPSFWVLRTLSILSHLKF